MKSSVGRPLVAEKKVVAKAMKSSGDLHKETVRNMQEYFMKNKVRASKWQKEYESLVGRNREKIREYWDKTDTLNETVREIEEEKMYEYMDQLGSGKSIPEEHLFFSLPMEVQLMVSDHMDTQTLLTCCLLSAKFRDFVQTTSKNYFHTVRVKIGATGNIALEITRENHEPEYFAVGYEVTWSSTTMQPVKSSNGQLARLFSTQRCPTFQTPCRTPPVCLLKSLLPASSVQYLQIIPCAKDEKPWLFEDAADLAEYYMGSYVIMELSKNPVPAVITTVLSRKTRLLLLCSRLANAHTVFKSFCTRKTLDVLIFLEDNTVTIEPDYEELFEEQLKAPSDRDRDLQFRVLFTDPAKFDSFKQKFIAAQNFDHTMIRWHWEGYTVYWKSGWEDAKRLAFHDTKMCIMLVWDRDVYHVGLV